MAVLYGVSCGMMWALRRLPIMDPLVGTVAIQMLCIALPAGVYLWVRRRWFREELPRLRARPRAWLGGALLGAGLPVCVTALAYWSVRGLPSPPGHPILPFPAVEVSSPIYAWTWGLQFVVLAALLEEFMFRGAILRGLAGPLGRPGAVVVSAVLFALAHWDVYGILPRTAMGIALGYAAVASGSLGPPIACHSVWNGVSLALLVTQEPALPDWGPPTWLLLAVPWGLGLALAGCALLGRAGSRSPLRVRSDATELAGVRAEIDRWASAAGLDRAAVAATVAAVHEAVLNAMEHGNENDPERWVTVELEDAPGKVVIRVGDEGSGVPPEGERPQASHDRGRGIALMRGLMDEVRFARGRGLVTLVKVKPGVARP